jgi:ClpP class serine protease
MMRLAAEAFNTPLMIDQAKAETIVWAFGTRLLGVPVRALENALGTADPRRTHAGVVGEPLLRAMEADGMRGFQVDRNVGVIGIEGTLVRKGAFLGQSSGETSYEGLTAQVSRAFDPAIKGVAFEVDSFGGQVNGVFELADRIAELSAIKPTIAILTDFALSAAYLLASQCRQIVMPPFGMAGSIGCIALHVNEAAALENEGLTITVIKAGALKDQGSSLGPPSDAYLAKRQVGCDEARLAFAAAVGRGRGARCTTEMALATEADFYEGEAAVAAGLVDAIANPRDAYEQFVAAVNAA